MFAIIKKELKQYFYSMVGFVFLAFFLAIVGLYTWAGNLSQGIGNFEMTLGNMTLLRKKRNKRRISYYIHHRFL